MARSRVVGDHVLLALTRREVEQTFLVLGETLDHPDAVEAAFTNGRDRAAAFRVYDAVVSALRKLPAAA